MKLSVEGRNVIITGGSEGLGLATALAYAKAGANVATAAASWRRDVRSSGKRAVRRPGRRDPRRAAAPNGPPNDPSPATPVACCVRGATRPCRRAS